MSFVAPNATTGSGTYGLHSTTWAAVQKALKRCGAKPHRTTGSHGSELMRLPTGGVVSVGKSKERRSAIMWGALKQLVDEVVKARLEPHLFLAVLDLEGCAWNSRPPGVQNLARWIRAENPPLRTEGQWKAALRCYADEARTKAQADAEARAERDREAAIEAETGAPSRFRYTATEVVDLVDLEPADRKRAMAYLSVNMTKGKGLPGELTEKGEAIRAQVPGKRLRTNRFTENGALALAQEIATRIGGAVMPPAPATPAPESPEAESRPSTAVEPAEARSEAPVSSDLGVTLSVPTPQVILDPHAALLALCARFGIEPSWDGFALDVEMIVVELEEATRSKGDPS